MFSGIGGFELGIGPLGQCVGFSEIDRHALTTYKEHFDHDNYGDATTLDPQQLPDIDLLVGGFPCQAFSINGKRRGFGDARGTLFFDVARVLADKRPRHLVLENVKGLLSHDSGKTFQTILGVLTDLGYRVEWQLLNSKDFGVPQNRDRTYLVGHRATQCARHILPLPPPRARTHPTTSPPSPVNSGAGEVPRRAQLLVREATAAQFAVAEPGDSVNVSRPESRTRRGRVGKAVANTLETTLTQAVVTTDLRLRRLTPVECERLQGFPDGWTIGTDRQRYKQCGNAVTVTVVHALMRQLAPCLR